MNRTQDDSREDWLAWVRDACKTLEIDPATVDVDQILDLTRDVAQRFTRPMAPVAAYLIGRAAQRHGVDQSAQLIEALLAGLPAPDVPEVS